MAGAMELYAGADSQQGGLKILARAEYGRGPNILGVGGWAHLFDQLRWRTLATDSLADSADQIDLTAN